MNTNEPKKIYLSPRIELITVEMEQGIAAASVSSEVQQSWENADDDNRTIDW